MQIKNKLQGFSKQFMLHYMFSQIKQGFSFIFFFWGVGWGGSQQSICRDIIQLLQLYNEATGEMTQGTLKGYVTSGKDQIYPQVQRVKNKCKFVRVNWSLSLH